MAGSESRTKPQVGETAGYIRYSTAVNPTETGGIFGERAGGTDAARSTAATQPDPCEPHKNTIRGAFVASFPEIRALAATLALFGQ